MAIYIGVGDEAGKTFRSWNEIAPVDAQHEVTAAELRCGLEDVLKHGAKALGVDLPDEAIQCFYPPDDVKEDPKRTIVWMEENDLINWRIDE